MNNLINIKTENGQQVVSARELYDFLEVKRDFSTWCKQMFEYGFEDGKDFTPILGKSTGGRPSIDYALSIDCSKEISMLQRSEKGKTARKYFLEIEKRYKHNVGAIDFSNPENVLKLAEHYAKENKLRLEAETKVERLTLTTEQQKKELKTLAPMVEYYEDVMQSNSLIAITVIASELGMSANKLNKTLHQQGVIYKNAGAWVLYSRHQGNGYTKTKTHTHTDHNGKEQTTIHTYWTEKGRAFIHSVIELLKKIA